MKARVQGKKAIVKNKENNAKDVNKEKNVKNILSLFLTMMEKDGSLNNKCIRRIFDSSLKDELFHFSTPSEFYNRIKNYHELKGNFFERIIENSTAEQYKKAFDDYMKYIDIDKLSSTILTEIKILEDSGVSNNYELIKDALYYHARRNVFNYNWALYEKSEEEKLEENTEKKSDEKNYKIEKTQFISNPILIAILTLEESDSIKNNRNEISKIANLNDLIKVQKPYDCLGYIHDDDARFRLMYTYLNYSFFGYDKLLFDGKKKWIDLDEIHRNEKGSIVESRVMNGLLSPGFMNMDKMLLTSGYRALECLEKNDYPISKNQLLSMCINIEKQLKDKKIILDNKYSVDDLITEINSNNDLVELKMKTGKLSKSELKELYLEGKTNYSILSKNLSKEEACDLFNAEDVVGAYSEYKKKKNDETKNKLYRISKVYRDSRIEYKKGKGDLLDEEYDILRQKLNETNENNGIIDFYKMGILDVSAIVQYNDSELIDRLFKEGVFSKSDIELLSDLDMINKRKLKTEVDKMPQSSKKELLQNNLTVREKNIKRRFMYSLDPEAKSIDVGDGYEIFFINDKAVIVDSLKPKLDTEASTIITSKEYFEQLYGLNGFFDSTYLNKRKNGDISLNKNALNNIKSNGVEFEFSKNWCDAILSTVAGPDAQRTRIYDKDSIAEQNRIIKNIKTMIEK